MRSWLLAVSLALSTAGGQTKHVGPAAPPPSLEENRAHQILSEALGDKNPDVRKQAVASLGLIGPREPYLSQINNAVSDKDVYAIVGPAGSQEVIAVAPIMGPANMAFISPSATRTDLTESNFKGFFRVVPRDDVQGTTDATFMVDQLKAKKVWIIDDQSAYATGLRDVAEKALKEKGVTVTTESITQKDSDFSTLVTKMKGDQPDVVGRRVVEERAQAIDEVDRAALPHHDALGSPGRAGGIDDVGQVVGGHWCIWVGLWLLGNTRPVGIEIYDFGLTIYDCGTRFLRIVNRKS